MEPSEDPIAPTEKDTNENNQPIVTKISAGQPRTYRLKHGDHWDVLNNDNPWTVEHDEYGNGLFWYQDWVRDCDESHSLEEMLTWPRTLPALQKVSNLTRASLFDFDWSPDTQIPLLTDTDTGDEYHIDISPYVSLPHIKCPSNGNPYGLGSAAPLFLFHSLRLPASLALPEGQNQEHVDQHQQPQRKTPRHAISLGHLHVRTLSSRSLEAFQEENVMTERADWDVILDAEDENLSIWIVVSRQQIKDHLLNEADSAKPLQPCPIFRGLMSTETIDYDCACILETVHRLGPDNPTAPNFSEVLDTIGSSRRIIDPAYTSLPENQKEKYAKGEPLDYVEPGAWPTDPNLELKITLLLLGERGITFVEGPPAPSDTE